MDFAPLLALLEAVVIASMLGVSEMAFRRARRREHRDDAFRSELDIARAVTFGILGVLVAFTVAMAQDRFLERRQLILDEANAIGTTYLRSKYLAPPHDAELTPLFRRYVEHRLAFYEAGGDVDATNRATAASDSLQNEIWAHTVAVVREHPEHGATSAEYVESLNAMIDLEDARVASLTAHVPPSIVVLVILVGLVSCATNGYACGVRGRRAWLSLVALPLLVAIAVCVILDLDSPRVGLVETGQIPMERLRDGMRAGAPQGEDAPRERRLAAGARR
jgi:hypothetical protein